MNRNDRLDIENKKNVFEGIDHNRLEKALSNLYSSVYKMDIKVTLKEKPSAATDDFPNE